MKRPGAGGVLDDPGGGGMPDDRGRLSRTAAVLAVAGAVAALVVMCAAVRVHPWSVLGIVLALPVAVVSGWHVVSRRGATRALAGAVLVVAVVAPVLHVLSHRPGALLVAMLMLGLSMASARAALQPLGRRPRRSRHRPHWRPSSAAAPRDGHAVLLVNCGSGSARTAAVAAALARREGVEVVLVEPGQDLGVLAEAVVAQGACMLGIAGGDGSMAAVAAVASRRGLPFVCVPTGTRNHFALDLGIDPADVPSAVSAFRAGSEVRVDLAEVDGRAFVNNVSMGLYAGLLASRTTGAPRRGRCSTSCRP